jgi:hypothetical protein
VSPKVASNRFVMVPKNLRRITYGWQSSSPARRSPS